MKQVHLLMLAVGMLFLSCTDKKNTPEYVAEHFLTAMENNNFDEAKKFSDSTTIKMVDMLKSISEMDKNKSAQKKNKKSDVVFKIEKVEKKGEDKAIVFYTSSKKKEMKQQIDVIKENGQWKVHFDKEQGKETPKIDENTFDGHDHDHSGHHHDEELEETEEGVDSLNVK